MKSSQRNFRPKKRWEIFRVSCEFLLFFCRILGERNFDFWGAFGWNFQLWDRWSLFFLFFFIFQVLTDLVQGEFMQLGSKETENERFTHYFTKTYRKTASLIANSVKAVSIFVGFLWEPFLLKKIREIQRNVATQLTKKNFFWRKFHRSSNGLVFLSNNPIICLKGLSVEWWPQKTDNCFDLLNSTNFIWK